MAEIKQRPDGSLAIYNEVDGLELFRVGGPATATAANPSWRNLKIVKMPLAAGVDTAGAIASWLNPEPVSILVAEVLLDVTTIATAACTVSIGTTAVSGTTSSANLIDTKDVNAAIGLFDNNTDKGTNGKTRQKLAAGGWVTASTATGASAGLVGSLYIGYVVL